MYLQSEHEYPILSTLPLCRVFRSRGDIQISFQNFHLKEAEFLLTCLSALKFNIHTYLSIILGNFKLKFLLNSCTAASEILYNETKAKFLA